MDLPSGGAPRAAQKAMKQYRRPTPEEVQLIEWLLRNGDREYREFADQIPRLRVVGNCDCGCPTIDLVLEGVESLGAGKKGLRILADFHGLTREGVSVGVILFASDGIISCLEAYSIFGGDEPFTFPRPQNLKPQDEMITEPRLGAVPRARGGHARGHGCHGATGR